MRATTKRVATVAVVCLGVMAACGQDRPAPTPAPPEEPVAPTPSPPAPAPEPEPPQPSTPASDEPAQATAGGTCTVSEPHTLATDAGSSALRAAVDDTGGLVAYMPARGQVSLVPVDGVGAPAGDPIHVAVEGARDLVGLVRQGDRYILVTGAGSSLTARAYRADGSPIGDPVRKQLYYTAVGSLRAPRTRVDPIAGGAVVVHDFETHTCDCYMLPLSLGEDGLTAGHELVDGGSAIYKVCDFVLGHRVLRGGDRFLVLAIGRLDREPVPLILTPGRRNVAYLSTDVGQVRAAALHDGSLSLIGQKAGTLTLYTQTLDRLASHPGRPQPMDTVGPVQRDALPAPFDQQLDVSLEAADGRLTLVRRTAVADAVGEPVDVGAIGSPPARQVPRAQAAWTGHRFLVVWPEPAGDGTAVRARTVTCAP